MINVYRYITAKKGQKAKTKTLDLKTNSHVESTRKYNDRKEKVYRYSASRERAIKGYRGTSTSRALGASYIAMTRCRQTAK